MASAAKNLVIGAVAITASFFVPVGAPAFISAALFSVGSSFAVRGLTRLFLTEKREGVIANVVSTQAELPVVYGEARVGIKIVDARIATIPTNDMAVLFEDARTLEDVLGLVGAFCLGSENGSGVESIRHLKFYNDIDASSTLNPLTIGALSQDTLVAPFGDPIKDPNQRKMWYVAQSGTFAQTVSAPLIDWMDWTADMRGRGIAYLFAMLRYDEETYRGGVPTITALVKGNRVYDPRSSTWVWSDNPALCILDYLTSKFYGARIPYAARDGGSIDEIDEDSFIDAANYFDELVSVPGGGTQKRFRCNGVLDPGQNPAENLTDLLSGCRSELLWEGGKYRIFTRKAQAPIAFELTEDNIIGQIDWARGGASVPNIIEGTYIDENSNYQPASETWPIVGDTAFLLQDAGIENKKTIDLPFTPNRYQAMQTIMVMLREMRQDVVIAVTATEAALQCRIGDVVRFTHSAVGFDQKEFWVVNISLLPNQQVRLILQEYDAAAYNLDALSANPTVPGTNLPNPFACLPPTNLVLLSDSTTVLYTQDGQKIPQILVSWDASPDPFLNHYRLRFRIAGGDWQYATDPGKLDINALITPITDGVEYEVELFAVNILGVPSQVITGTVTGGTEPGDDVWLALSSFGVVERTNTYHKVGWVVGGGVGSIWVYKRKVQHTEIILPGADAFSGVTPEILSSLTDRYTIDVPEPGYYWLVMFVPRGTDGDTSGPSQFYTVNPLSDRPDMLNSVTIKGVHEDGSVVIHFTANPLAGSVKWAANIGTAPSEPSLADVEAGGGGASTGGTVVLTNGIGSVSLGAATVPRGQWIMVKAVGYQNADGTGTDGITDHSDALTARWERTKFVAPTLEIVTETEETGVGVFRVKVLDQDARATALYYRTKSGAGNFGAWTLKSGTPTHNTEYEETVALQEGHPSFVEFRLDYNIGGVDNDFTISSKAFDAGNIPQVLELAIRIDEAARTASAEATGDFDLAKIRILGSTVDFPSDAAVRAAAFKTPSNGRSFSTADIGTLASGLAVGDTVYVKAIGYGPNDEEASSFVLQTATVRLVQPTLEPATNTETATTATYGVIVRDEGGQAEDLYYRTRSWSGGTPGEWSAWTLKTASPANGVEYTETVDLKDGHDAQIEFRLDYDILGQANAISSISPTYDPGLVPKVIVHAVYMGGQNVSAITEGDSDTASTKTFAKKGSEPTLTEVRAATAINGRYAHPSDLGNLITDANAGDVIHIAALGYSASGGGGTESPDIARTQLIRPGVLDGEVTSTKLDDEAVDPGKLKEAAQKAHFDGEFSGTSRTAISWTAGSLRFAGTGTIYSIVSGTLSSMVVGTYYYVYFDKNISTTVLQTTTSQTTATSGDAVLIAIVKPGSASGQDAWIFPALGGRAYMEAFNIGPGSITTVKIDNDAITSPKIVAGAVDTSELAALAVEAGKIAAGAVTATEITVASLASISVNAGTITAGTISTNVLIASDTFTANSPVFEGSVEVEDGAGSTRIFLGASGGGLINLFSSGGGLAGSLFAFAGGSVSLIASSELQLGSTEDVYIKGEEITFGAADSAGVGFRQVRVPN